MLVHLRELGRQVYYHLSVYTSFFCFSWHECMVTNAIACNSEKSNKEYCKQLWLHTTKRSTRSTPRWQRATGPPSARLADRTAGLLAPRRCRFSSLELIHPRRTELIEAAHIKSADFHGLNHLATSICRGDWKANLQMASPMLF